MPGTVPGASHTLTHLILIKPYKVGTGVLSILQTRKSSLRVPFQDPRVSYWRPMGVEGRSLSPGSELGNRVPALAAPRTAGRGIERVAQLSHALVSYPLKNLKVWSPAISFIAKFPAFFISGGHGFPSSACGLYVSEVRLHPGASPGPLPPTPPQRAWLLSSENSHLAFSNEMGDMETMCTS